MDNLGCDVGSAVLCSGFPVSGVVFGNTTVVVTVFIFFGVVLGVVSTGSVLSVFFSVDLVVVSGTVVMFVVTGKGLVVGDVVEFEVLIVVGCDGVDDVIFVVGSGEGSGEGVSVLFDSGVLSFPAIYNSKYIVKVNSGSVVDFHIKCYLVSN